MAAAARATCEAAVSAAVSVASEPDAELRRENDELRSEVLRLRESLALADARRATAERGGTRRARGRGGRRRAAALAAGGAQRPTAGRERGHRAAPRAVQAAARCDERETGPGPPGEGCVASPSWSEGDLAERAARGDLRLRFRPSDEDAHAGGASRFHRQWHL